MTPWSGHADENTPSGSFTLTNDPGGGSCPKTLAERPFAPSYTAASDSTQAGAYSPFRVHIGRPDGQQELKVVNVTLPKGLTGNLAGIPYCSEAALAAAADSSGIAEQASSSCPADSQIGDHDDRRRNRQRPAQDRRQGLPRRSLQGRSAVAGGDHAGRRRAVRPRHRRGPGRAQRRPGNRPGQRGLRPDPRRLRRGQAGHPLDRRQRRPQQVHAQPDQLRRAGNQRRDQRRRRRPGQSGGVQLLRGQRPVSRPPTATASASSRSSHTRLSGPTKRGEEPAHPGDPGSARRRRQRQPHGADVAALAVPRPEPHPDGLHEAAAGLADVPEGGGLRPRAKR